MSKTEAGPPVRILFAEDDDTDFLFIEEALSEAGISNKYERVLDGSALLDRLRSGGADIDVVMLDLNMAPMTGLEALEIIRKDAQLRDLDVVVLTTSTTDEDTCARLGVRKYHVKPVEHHEFVDIFREVLGYYFQPNPGAA